MAAKKQAVKRKPRRKLGGDRNTARRRMDARNKGARVHAQGGLPANERLLHDVFDAIQDGISVLDRELNIVRVNAWMQNAYVHAAPLVGKKCYAAYQRRQSPCPWCPTVKALETGETHSAVVPYPCAEDPSGWMDLSAFPLRDADKRVVGVIEYVKDITAQKRTEEALREREDQFRAVLAAVPDVMLVLDTEGRYRNIFTTEPDLLVAPADQLRDRTIHEVLPEKEAQRIQATIERTLTSGEPQTHEYALEVGGVQRWFSARIVRFESQDEPCVLWVARDITKHKRTEEALRLAQFSVDHTAMATFWLGPDARLLRVNDAACRALGYTRAELLSMTVHDLDPNFPAEVWPDHWRELKERGSMTFESRHRTKDGRIFPVEITINYLEFKGREYNFAFARDISGRKQAEEALRAAEQEKETILDSLIEHVVHEDTEMRVRWANRAACESVGLTRAELIGRRCYEVWAECDGLCPDCPVAKAMSTGQAHEMERATADGRAWHIRGYPVRDEGGSITGGVEVRLDITERRRAEEERAKLEAQLRQAQKMEAIGQLASGVAHDFNNILTAILGNVELMQAEVRAELPREEMLLTGLAQIDRSGQRAVALTRQLLAFSRHQLIKPEVLDPNRTLIDMERMLEHLVGERISLELSLAPDLKRIRADATQVEQVIMNLVVNARDAMPDGGRLTIESANVVLDEGFCAAHADARPGPHVVLSVSDTGCGMDEQTVQRAFEPFFTTKAPGRGTGLGLSTVYGIVKQSDGFVTTYSEPRRGTTFRVYLPSVDVPATVPADHPAVAEAPGGHETILVCEDEESVRTLACRILESRGYTVLAAENGTRALKLSAEHSGPIDLLLTDVVMPDMDGDKLAEALRAKRPDVKVLYVSGYTSNVVAHQGILDEGVNFLEKPFGLRSLLENVRKVLDNEKR